MQMISKNKLSKIFKDFNKEYNLSKQERNFQVEDKVCDLIDQLKDNYQFWAKSCGIGQEQVDKFNTGFNVRTGNKYIKIITQGTHRPALSNGGSVWGFVCLYDDHKFKRGDILKPAGFNAPARNFARGNIFKLDSYNAVWTGA